jgi:formylglycine-generating enzyme required for sulfatase activity
MAGGASVNAKDADGRTPIHWAMFGDHVEMVKLLKSHGGDVTLKDARPRWLGGPSTAFELLGERQPDQFDERFVVMGVALIAADAVTDTQAPQFTDGVGPNDGDSRVPVTRGSFQGEQPSVHTAVETSVSAFSACINPRDGAEMIRVPAGEFLMGDDGVLNNPRRIVTLSGYYIYRNLVTVHQYEQFCSVTGSEMPAAPPWGWWPDHPMVNVSWFDVLAYAVWAGMSLPTDAQWERAARGTDGRAFPWGGVFDEDKLWSSARVERRTTTSVGKYGISPIGCTDMAGNVYQWCADFHQNYYYRGTSNVDPKGPPSGERRIVRGGAWIIGDPLYFRCAVVAGLAPDTINCNFIGFRCASGV